MIPGGRSGGSEKVFAGIRFVLFGFDSVSESQYRSELLSRGGVDAGRYDSSCTHVIVSGRVYDDPVCVAARNDGKTLVTDLWIEDSIDFAGLADPTRFLYKPVKDLNGIPGSDALHICLTGYQRRERDDIMKMVELMGAHFSKPLIATKITHLICYKFEGEKYELAKRVNIKLVNHRWLEDCLKAWEILPIEDYKKSGWELEVQEAEAKDSEEETEDENAKSSLQRYSHTALVLPKDPLIPEKSELPMLPGGVSKIQQDAAAAKASSCNADDAVSGSAIYSSPHNKKSSSNTSHCDNDKIPSIYTLQNGNRRKQPSNNCIVADAVNITDAFSPSGLGTVSTKDENKLPFEVSGSLRCLTMEDRPASLTYSRKAAKKSASSDLSCHLHSPQGGVIRNNVNVGSDIFPVAQNQDVSIIVSTSCHSKSTSSDLCHLQDSSSILPQKRKVTVPKKSPHSPRLMLQRSEASPVRFPTHTRAVEFDSTSLTNTNKVKSNMKNDPQNICPKSNLSGTKGSTAVENHYVGSSKSNFLGHKNASLQNRLDLPGSHDFVVCLDSHRGDIPFNDGVVLAADRITSSPCNGSKLSVADNTKSNLNDTIDPGKSTDTKMSIQRMASHAGSLVISGKDPTLFSSLEKHLQMDLDASKECKTAAELDKKSAAMNGLTSVATSASEQLQNQNTDEGTLSSENKDLYIQNVDEPGNSEKAIKENVSNTQVKVATRKKKLCHKTKKKKADNFDYKTTPSAKCPQMVSDESKIADRVDAIDITPEKSSNAPNNANEKPCTRNVDEGVLASKNMDLDLPTCTKSGNINQINASRISNAITNVVARRKNLCHKTKPSAGDTIEDKAATCSVKSLGNIGAEMEGELVKTPFQNINVAGPASMNIDINHKSKPLPSSLNNCYNEKEKMIISKNSEKENVPVESWSLNSELVKNTGSQEGKKGENSKLKGRLVKENSDNFGNRERRAKCMSEPVWFILSGHRLQRKEFRQVIRRLGGRVCKDSHQWSYQATHIIVPDPLRRTEKFFAAAAAGRWILKTDYLTASNEADKWIGEDPFEWYRNGLTEDGTISLEAPRKWRLLREKTGHGALHGMHVIIYGECIAPSLDTLKRVVKAGDGTILATSPPYSRFLESNVDFAIISPGMPLTDLWIKEFVRHEIPCVLVDYLVEYICKPGYPLDKHVLYSTHGWAQKSLANLITRSEELISDDEASAVGNDELSCAVCGSRDRGDVMLICGDEEGSGCGIGTHIDCCNPPLNSVPTEEWFCSKCCPKRGSSIPLKGKRKGK